MQSDGNRFWGDVVFDSFNMAYQDENSILDWKYEKQISLALYYEYFKFEESARRICIFKEIQHITTRN